MTDHHDETPLHGQVALVTGGGRGIGRAIALGLAEAGMAVAIVSRTAGELDETAAAVEARGVSALALRGDVRECAFVEGVVDTTLRKLGRVDLLVNGAGTARAIGPLWEVDPDTWWADVETNLRGAFLFARAVMPHMIERAHGRIINVSSNVAIRPSPYLTAYAAAKTALLSLTESLAAESGEHGVTVFAVTPGYVLTQMTANMLESREGQRWLPEVKDKLPVDVRLIVDLVAILASGRGDEFTGRYLRAVDDIRRLDPDAVRVEDADALRLRRWR